MITPSEQQRTVERLEGSTHLASHLLLALAMAALLLAHWPLLAALLLGSLVVGGSIGWLRRERYDTLWWYVIGAGVLVTFVATALQLPSTPLTFDGVLGLLGCMLAGLGACQAFERASTRASALRHLIAFVLLAVAATTVLRNQPLWSLGALALFVALWVFARRGTLLLDKLRQQPLTLVNFSPHHGRWTGQIGSSTIALCLIGISATLAFQWTPRVPLPSMPAFKAPFGSLSLGDTTPHTEDQSVAGYLEAELLDTLQEVGRAKDLEQLDQLQQQAHGLLTFLEDEGKVEAKQLELLRKFSDNLTNRRVRQLSKSHAQERMRERQQPPAQEPRPPIPQPPQPEEEHRQALQEEIDFLREVLPQPAQELEALERHLQQQTTPQHIQQTHTRMEQVAQQLPPPVNIETPELQRLIQQVVQDRQQRVQQAQAAQRTQEQLAAQEAEAEARLLREAFARSVQQFTTTLQRHLQQQPPEPAWQRHTETLRQTEAAAQAQQAAAELMQLLQQAEERRHLTAEATSSLAQQLDRAADVRMQIAREELRRPGATPQRLQAQRASTQATLTAAAQHLEQLTSPSSDTPSAAARQAAQAAAAEVQMLQAQHALQQAAQHLQDTMQHAVPRLTAHEHQALQQAAAQLAQAADAAEARNAVTQLDTTLEQIASPATTAQDQHAWAGSLRLVAAEVLQQQAAAEAARQQARRVVYLQHHDEAAATAFGPRPYVLIGLTIVTPGEPPAPPRRAASLALGEQLALLAEGEFLDPTAQPWRSVASQLLLPGMLGREVEEAARAVAVHTARCLLLRQARQWQTNLYAPSDMPPDLLRILERQLQELVAADHWSAAQRVAGLLVSSLGRLEIDAQWSAEITQALADPLRALLRLKCPPLSAPLTDVLTLDPNQTMPPLHGTLPLLSSLSAEQRQTLAPHLTALLEQASEADAAAAMSAVERAIDGWREGQQLRLDAAETLLAQVQALGWAGQRQRRAREHLAELLQRLHTAVPEYRALTEEIIKQVDPAALERLLATPVRSFDLTHLATWTSDHPAVAIINNTGGVISVGEGRAHMTATALSLTSLPTTILVTPPYLLRLEVEPSRATVERGRTVTCTARGLYSDQQTRPVRDGVQWVSRAPAIAAITADGVVQGLRIGQTEILARAGQLTSLPVHVRVFYPVWKRLLRWLLLLLALLTVVWVFLYARRRATERRLAMLQQQDPRRFIIAVYHFLARQWGWIGLPRQLAMIPEEYEQILRPQCSAGALAMLHRVTEVFLRAKYSLAPIDVAHSDEMAQAHDTLTADVCARLAVWQRLWLWARGGMLRLGAT